MRKFINYIRRKIAEFIYPEIDKIKGNHTYTAEQFWEQFCKGYDDLS